MCGRKQPDDHLQSKAVLVSLAPKASIANLSAGLGGFNRIVRMIPNAPTVINKGYNPVAFSQAFDKKEKKDLSDFFKVLGDCPEVVEEKLEAYAILMLYNSTLLGEEIRQVPVKDVVTMVDLGAKSVHSLQDDGTDPGQTGAALRRQGSHFF